MFMLLLGFSSIIIQLSDAYINVHDRELYDIQSDVDAVDHAMKSDKRDKNIQELAPKHNNEVKQQKYEPATDNEEHEIKRSNGRVLSMNKNDAKPRLNQAGVKGRHQNPSQANDQIMPKKINFRNGESSVLYEINAKSVIKAIEDLLSSKLTRRYLDTLTRKAAFAFRSLNEPED